jgi:hypothetical protein
VERHQFNITGIEKKIRRMTAPLYPFAVHPETRPRRSPANRSLSRVRSAPRRGLRSASKITFFMEGRTIDPNMDDKRLSSTATNSRSSIPIWKARRSTWGRRATAGLLAY